MTAAPTKTRGTVEAVARVKSNPYEKLASNCIASADDALYLLRQAQAAVSGIAQAIDRLSDTAAALIGGAK